ncbi:ABC transporter permease [Stygiolobus caldivivus]|uniref:Uncharacterized protein n=1 Tax=Stygiolobus caldivivus TaxID=2824673 RepID=A0A8D5U6I6_9CREN|nr:ABC transporter permease [Stygiolobus caldivivus]BCU69744.1 hypothetical protein KN1_10410 [Stygiolobus caldivivus]
MRLLNYTVKRLLTNPYILGWAVLFTALWAFMGAYIFSSGITALKSSLTPTLYQEAVYYYTAGWAGGIVIFSLGAFSTTLTSVLFYQTGSLSHLFRYSKLTPTYYVIAIYVGSVIASTVIGGVLIALVYFMFSNEFGFSVYPKSLVTLLPYILLSSFFFVSFSMSLDLLTLKVSRRAQNLITYIPVILAYLFGYGYLSANMSSVVNLSPYTVIQTLIMSAYLGKPAPVNYSSLFVLNSLNPSGPTISVPISLLSISVWVAVLTVVDVMVLRRLYYKPLEEGKLL